MHRILFHPLRWALFISLIAILAACSSTAAPQAKETAPYYLATVDIDTSITEVQLKKQYGGEIVSFVPEAGFAVLGFSKEDGELSTLATTTNQDTFASPEVSMGGYSAWSSGYSSWASGWSAWAGGFSAWAGGYSAWASGNSSSGTGTNLTAWNQIKLKEAHAISRKFGEGVKVAVIDTGIDLSHTMFQGRLSPSTDWWDYVDNDSNPQEASSGNGKGHGTAVASIILQVAPNAKIIPIRVLDSDGKGDTDAVIKAIQRAIDKGANVINISLGSTQWDDALWNMAAYANQKGILIFSSSGNYGGEGTMTNPGAFSWTGGAVHGRTLGIGSVDSSNRVSSFTSYGYNLFGVAPGENIVAAYPGNQSVKVTGTSFATPMFTGAAALALGEMPNPADTSKLFYAIWDSLDFNVATQNGIDGALLLNVEGLIRNLPGFTEPQYRIKNVNSGKCLEVYGGNTSNAGNVDQWWCYTTSWNQWKLIPVGTSYKIINANSGKALDIVGSSMADGANVQQWGYVGANNQKWNLVTSSNGSFELKAVHSNKCLDVSGGSLLDGANVQQGSCNGTGAQKWTLELVN